MTIRKNLSKVLHSCQHGRSLEEYSSELGVSKSMLQTYLSGQGNPRADTLEQIAERLNLSPVGLLSGEEPKGYYVPPLLNTLEAVSNLSEEERRQFCSCFHQLLLLLGQEYEGSEDCDRSDIR